MSGECQAKKQGHRAINVEKGPKSVRRNPGEPLRGIVVMEILSTLALLAVAFLFAFMAFDAARRAK